MPRVFMIFSKIGLSAGKPSTSRSKAGSRRNAFLSAFVASSTPPGNCTSLEVTENKRKKERKKRKEEKKKRGKERREERRKEKKNKKER